MTISGFKRLKLPAYSPQFTPCDFFLFSHIKKKLNQTVFRDEPELSLVVWSIMAAIPGDLLLSLFLGR
jgi:hypothetical protein